VVASVVTDVAKRLWLLLAYGQRLIGVVLERSASSRRRLRVRMWGVL